MNYKRALVLCLIGSIISLIIPIFLIMGLSTYGIIWVSILLSPINFPHIIAGLLGMIGAIVGLLGKKAGIIICLVGGIISLFALFITGIMGGTAYIILYIFPTLFILVGGILAFFYSRRE